MRQETYLVRHLKKRPYIWRKLGFKALPSRRTLDRWKKKHDFELGQVMKHMWTIVKGFKAKATFVLTSVLAMQAIAIYNIKRVGYPSIRIAELRV